jgi:hypothetical protein
MPVSTEQILGEQSFFGETRDVPTAVSLPPDRANPAAHEETMGSFGTRLFIYQHLKDHTAAMHAAAGWDGDRYRIVRSGNDRGVVWASVWDSAVDAAQFVDAVGQAIGKRYRTSAPTVSASGVRTYVGARRTVVITPREIGGRNVVVYVDVPTGAPASIIDPARISLAQ